MTVILMVGPSGSGKTTMTKTLVNSRTAVCSADTFFTDEFGGYHFNYEKLGEAHKKCQMDFRFALADSRIERIIVDNTNTTSRERSFYCRQALLNHHRVFAVVLSANLVECAARNIHGVSLDIVKKMSQRIDLKPGIHECYLGSSGALLYTYLGPDFKLPL